MPSGRSIFQSQERTVGVAVAKGEGLSVGAVSSGWGTRSLGREGARRLTATTHLLPSYFLLVFSLGPIQPEARGQRGPMMQPPELGGTELREQGRRDKIWRSKHGLFWIGIWWSSMEYGLSSLLACVWIIPFLPTVVPWMGTYSFHVSISSSVKWLQYNFYS